MCSVSINFKHVQPLVPGEPGLASFPSISSSTYSRKEPLGIRGTGFGRAMGPLCVLSVCPVCLSVTLVYCGQTVGWIKVPLGTEVGLGPGDIVLDGDPAPSPTERGTAASTFWPMSFVAKRSPISATAELVADWMPLCRSCRPSTVSKYWRTLRALVAAL